MLFYVSDMSKIDVREAALDTISSKIGEELRAYAKKHGGINALVESSGVSRSTLNRLFNGNSVSTEVLFRTLRALERWDILNLLTESPRLTPIERLSQERKISKKKSIGKATASSTSKQSGEPYSHVKMADPEAILANLKKRS